MTSNKDNTDGDSGIDLNMQRLGIKVTTFAVIFGFIWFFRPWFQPFIYWIRYSLGGLILLGVPLLLGLVLFFAPPIRSETMDSNSIMVKSSVFVGLFAICLVLGLILGLTSSMFAERTIAEDVMSDVEFVDQPPEMNAENPRITPRAVSDTQTDGTLSYPQHQLGDSDIARDQNGSLVWSYPLEPDQLRNQFSGNQRGAIHSDMTSMEDRNIQSYDAYEFEYGQNMRIHHNIDWQMKKQGGFWSAYRDDPYEFMYEGEMYMAFPKTGHEWNLTPIPHTTPTWDGVALVHQDGTIEHLSPEEAQERPELDGQRLFPLDISDSYAKALGYRNGILNQMPVVGTYENVVTPADMPSGVGNDQPFTVDMDNEQMNYMFAMEPSGGGSGLSEIWFFNAEDGEMRAYETGSDNIFGPDRAVGIARGTDTRTEWGPDGEAMAVEPILVTVDDELWWHIKVTTSDQTEIVRNIFINANSGSADAESENALVMESTDEVVDFMRGDINESELETADESSLEIDEDDETVDQEPSTDENVAYYIVIKDDDGNVIDRIPVTEEQETVIEQNERTQNNTG